MTKIDIDPHLNQSVSNLFKKEHCYLLDGGFATQLEANGHIFSDDDILWSSKLLISDPMSVVKVHKQYLEAGADIITTNSYQANIDGFKTLFGLNKDEALAAITNSVTLAQKAIDEVYTMSKMKATDEVTNDFKGPLLNGHKPDNHLTSKVLPLPKGYRPLIAGSVGPYGAALCDGSEYTGSYDQAVSKAFLKAWHKPRIMALLAANVDILALETFPCFKEAMAVIELVESLGEPCPPIWVSFTLRENDYCTSGAIICDGKPFEDAYVALLKYDSVIAVGANCVSPKDLEPILGPDGKDGPKPRTKPLVFYPNSGELWDKCGKSWYGSQSCVPLASLLPSWVQGGARFIGGCCRVLHTDIAEMRKALDAYIKHS